MIGGDKKFGPGHPRYDVQAEVVEQISPLYWGWKKIIPRIPKENFDVVSSQDPFYRGVLAWLIARRSGVHLNIQVHADISAQSFLKRQIARFVLSRAHSIRVVSERIREQISSYSRAPITVLPVFVDIDSFQAIERRASEHPTMLWIGRFEDEKDPLSALDIFETVLRNMPDARMIMIGSGTLENDLKLRAKNLPISFPGWRDLRPFLETATMVLSTSKSESWGASIIESLAAHVPVVALDVGIAKEAGAIIVERHKLADASIRALRHPAPATLKIPILYRAAWQSTWLKSFENIIKPMRLLIITQVVDKNHSVLGFFHRWIEEFAKHCESVIVICLEKGEYDLPRNVEVYSLGKEMGVSKLKLLFRFYFLIFNLRHRYNFVFVHMNQEYILIGGFLWKLLKKKILFWRNHYDGSLLTDVASIFCDKIFCTSKSSYTARYKKTMIMPVGVDTERFKPDESIRWKPRSILFLARMSPSKRPEMLIDALSYFKKNNVDFTVSFYGSPLPHDEAYYEGLKKKVYALGLAHRVSFYLGIPNSKTPDLYHTHEIFVNTSPPGMLDKTIFEAAASGCHVLAASTDFAELAGREYYFNSSVDLAERLMSVFVNQPTQSLQALVEKHSLTVLAKKLIDAIMPRQ